jgi:hypothetical protein
MVRFSINKFISAQNLIIFYWCFFYFSQFTYIGDYFDSWFMPSSYVIVILGVVTIFFTSNNKKISRYFFISLIPLLFDIVLNIGIINYWLFAVKYSCLFLIIGRNTYSNKQNPFNKASRIIFNFYLLSFVVSLPFLFGFDFLPEIDPTLLRKNIEGNGEKSLYNVTSLFSGYLTGEFPIYIFDIPISRFTSFHFEPSNFTLYFIPLTIINWKYLNFLKKILLSLMILFSFSVTSFIILPIIFVIKFLFNNKRNKLTIFLFLLTLFIGVLISTNFILKNTSIGKLVYYKLFESSSFDNTISQNKILDVSNLFLENSFNKIPAQSEITGVNPISFILWFFFITLVTLYSYRKKKSNQLALTYFLLHSLKSVSHMYPSFFLLYLLFINNKDEIIQLPTTKKISN